MNQILNPTKSTQGVHCLLWAALACNVANAAVEPLLDTRWGQSDVWQTKTPLQNGQLTYPGCTTISTAQVLYYYQHQNSAASEETYVLDHNNITGADITGNTLSIDLPSFQYQWSEMAKIDTESTIKTNEAAEFIYHTGTTLHAQFGGDQGTSATGKQIENAFRYQWGFNDKSRRSMSIISKEAFNFSDQEWADVIRTELDLGRPVIYNALRATENAGHSFVIDGYRDDGKVHVNWGWGGYGNGYYDVNEMQDPSGRRWNRLAMIYRGLEPVNGRGIEIKRSRETVKNLDWVGNASLISKTSGNLTGYGLTQDEVSIPAHQTPVASFVQWEVDPSDGERLLISSDNSKLVSIQYGIWNDRSKDRLYENVTLPFVLDPKKDGYTSIEGEYFVIAIIDNTATTSTQIITLKATEQAANTLVSSNAESLLIGQSMWQGNGSIISYTSGTNTGYGLTQDELVIVPAAKAPVLFFQWEVDERDGKKLKVDAVDQTATVTYGLWNDRSKDVTHSVKFPYTIDPITDGIIVKGGDYLVIKIEFDNSPAKTTTVSAQTVK
jgi:hypothetical protein